MVRKERIQNIFDLSMIETSKREKEVNMDEDKPQKNGWLVGWSVWIGISTNSKKINLILNHIMSVFF